MVSSNNNTQLSKKEKYEFSVKEDRYKIRDICLHDYGRKEIERLNTKIN